jgi:hypothetical protein
VCEKNFHRAMLWVRLPKFFTVAPASAATSAAHKGSIAATYDENIGLRIHVWEFLANKG